MEWKNKKFGERGGGMEWKEIRSRVVRVNCKAMGGQIIGSAPWIREIKSDAPVTMSRREIRSSSPVSKRNLSFLRDQPDTVGSSPL